MESNKTNNDLSRKTVNHLLYARKQINNSCFFINEHQVTGRFNTSNAFDEYIL